jgi:hypothetical protein
MQDNHSWKIMFNKKIIMFFLLASLIVVLPGCTKESQNLKFEDAYGEDGEGVLGTFCNAGVLYSHKGITYLFNPDTEMIAPICTRINCSHQGKSPQNPHPSCDAYLGEIAGYTAIIGDYLYYVSRPDEATGSAGMFEKEFCRADKDGTNRTILYKADDISFSTIGKYENGYFLYGYYNQEYTNGEPREKDEVGMCVLNLETEEMTQIKLEDLYGGRIGGMTVVEDSLYYRVSYNTESLKGYDFAFFTDPANEEFLNSVSRIEIWKYNLKTGEKDLYYSGSREQSVMGLGYGYLYYSDNQDTEQVVKNLKTGKEYRVIESVRNTPFISGEGIYLPGDGKIKLWKYETENVEEIGSYPDNEEMIIQWISKDYVYAIVFYENGYKTMYYDRDEFMKGHFTGREYTVGN